MASMEFIKWTIMMTSSDKNCGGNPREAFFIDTTPAKRSRIAMKISQQMVQSGKFCPEGWDEQVEDYWRRISVSEDDENALLDHLFTCKHCADHVSFLESLADSLKT